MIGAAALSSEMASGSRKENASKKRQRPVLIQSEPASRLAMPQIFYGGVPISRKSRPA
jgi:hypothetical protein